MKDLTKVFINLSKCSEEQIKKLEKRTTKKFYYIKRAPFLHLFGKHWNQCMSESYSIKDKTELLYPDFIKLFEGGEDNNGWIKIESEADLPKDFDDFWVINDKGEIHMTEFNPDYKKFHDYFSDRYDKVTHYQPIQKPLPPKF